MPPFHADGAGIDVELGRARRIAGVAFAAAVPGRREHGRRPAQHGLEGHYLVTGPADVLLHVPVDRPLMEANPRCACSRPLARARRDDRARNLEQLPALDSLAALAGRWWAVPASRWPAGCRSVPKAAARQPEHQVERRRRGRQAALQRGEVVAAAGLASELQAVLRGDARFVIEPLPSPRAPRDGWAVGMAVKKDATELAQALQEPSISSPAAAAGGDLRQGQPGLAPV